MAISRALRTDRRGRPTQRCRASRTAARSVTMGIVNADDPTAPGATVHAAGPPPGYRPPPPPPPWGERPAGPPVAGGPPSGPAGPARPPGPTAPGAPSGAP